MKRGDVVVVPFTEQVRQRLGALDESHIDALSEAVMEGQSLREMGLEE